METTHAKRPKVGRFFWCWTLGPFCWGENQANLAGHCWQHKPRFQYHEMRKSASSTWKKMVHGDIILLLFSRISYDAYLTAWAGSHGCTVAWNYFSPNCMRPIQVGSWGGLAPSNLMPHGSGDEAAVWQHFTSYSLQTITVHWTYQVINEAENIDQFFEILGTTSRMHLYIKFGDSKRTCLHCLPNPRTAQVPCTSFPEQRTVKLLNTKTCGCPWNDRNTHTWITLTYFRGLAFSTSPQPELIHW